MALNFKERILSLVDEYTREREAKNGAYRERNLCVGGLVVLAMQHGWRVGKGLHDPTDAAWEPEWRNLVFIDLPTGQVSWHIHDSEMSLFQSLPWYTDLWDGHSTPEKYRRLNALGRWFKAEAEKAEAEREAKKVTPIRPAVTVEEEVEP